MAKIEIWIGQDIPAKTTGIIIDYKTKRSSIRHEFKEWSSISLLRNVDAYPEACNETNWESGANLTRFL